jgi:hypothetical protein
MHFRELKHPDNKNKINILSVDLASIAKRRSGDGIDAFISWTFHAARLSQRAWLRLFGDID